MRIIEERHYRMKPGMAGKFAANYERNGLPLQLEYLQDFLGYFFTETGELNGVVALWAFDSMDDRAARRDAMMADPRWQVYLDSALPMVEHQQIRFLRPSSFSPIK